MDVGCARHGIDAAFWSAATAIAAVRRAPDLGATPADDLDSDDDPNLRVLRDPGGNEFCLVLRRPEA
jgi:hypothetical protein